LKQIASENADVRVQEAVVDTLADTQAPEAVATLHEIARSNASTDVRREAVEALADRAAAGDVQESAERATILELLSTIATANSDIEVQIQAIESLGEISHPDASARLRELAQNHSEERIRAEAVETLGESSSAASLAGFLKNIALGDRSTQVQDKAIETLGDLPDGAGISALVDLARDHPAANMRKEALETLMDSDQPKAKEFVERLLRRSPGR
jgi:HEAT repeat protein